MGMIQAVSILIFIIAVIMISIYSTLRTSYLKRRIDVESFEFLGILITLVMASLMTFLLLLKLNIIIWY